MGGYVGKLQLGDDTQNQIAFGDLLYGVCNTTASAAAKEIETADFTTFDRYIAGVQIRVKFTNGNTATSGVTLKIKVGTTPIAYDVLGDCTCGQNEVITFTFDEYTENSQLKRAWRVTGGGVSQSIKDYVASATSDLGTIAGAMVFKGTLGSGGNISTVPDGSSGSEYKAGYTYKIITDGTYANIKCEIGDLLIAIADSTSGQNEVNNAHWTVAQTNIDGAVTGPTVPAGTTITNQVAVFSDNTGKVINYSGRTIASDVPANAVFTDTNTTYQYSLANNTAVAAYSGCSVANSGGTVLVSVSDGVLHLEKGISFTTTNVLPSTTTLNQTSVAGPSLTPSGT